MKIISVDDHLIEHPRVWTDRLPAKYRDRGPHVVSDSRFDFWVYEDRAETLGRGLTAAAGHTHEEYSADPISKFSAMIPGCYDPLERVKDMDIDGVWGSLCFPSYPRFAGVRFMTGRDKDLALLCVQAYNDFLIDEWCAAAPDRLIPLGIVPLWDANLAAKEVERVAARGVKSISWPEAFEPLGLPSFHTGYWDPVFSAASEAGLPLSTHFGTSQRPYPVSSDAQGMNEGASPAGLSIVCWSLMSLMADYTFSHVFHKFPKLKITLSEGGAGWIPYLKERMDWTWNRQKFWSGINSEVSPSELFLDHFYACMIDDEVGIRNRDLIGVNNILIESDYPHSDGSWPYTRKRACEMLADVPDDEAHRIVELNARELYNFPA